MALTCSREGNACFGDGERGGSGDGTNEGNGTNETYETYG
jgi:hypothetical protein